jgi:hypothetical protein
MKEKNKNEEKAYFSSQSSIPRWVSWAEVAAYDLRIEQLKCWSWLNASWCFVLINGTSLTYQ